MVKRRVYVILLILTLSFSILASSQAKVKAAFCAVTNQNSPSDGSADVLIKWLEFFENNVNWTENMDTKYMGYILGNTTLADLRNGVWALANKTSTSWQDVLIWCARLHKYGIDNQSQTLIKWALDNATMMDNGLPQVAVGSGRIKPYPYFAVTFRELLWGFYWAIEYGDTAELAKWNLTTAYDTMRSAWKANGKGFMYIYNDSTTYEFLDRYYDEEAETMACFVQFYAFNVTNALQDAQAEWNYINANYWVSYPIGQEHYGYLAGNITEWECEAGGFLQIAKWLNYCSNNSLPFMNRTIIDFQNRFLANGWNSYQWNYYEYTNDTSVPVYCVVHSYPSNPQHRLINTIISWSSIMGVFGNFSSNQKQNAINLLEGYDGYDPAWKLLFNSTCGLFNPTSLAFRLTNDDSSPYNNLSTSFAVALIFLLGIVPINATLAIPIEEMHYEYIYNALDHDLFSIDLGSRNVTVSIGIPGTVAFLFNSTVYQNFSENGTFEIQFSSDWNSIVSVARIGDLPSNRIYLFETIPELSLFSFLMVLTCSTLLLVILFRIKKMKGLSRATSAY